MADSQQSDETSGHDAVIEGHRYDGIREYDNPMPGWWVWIFILTIVFSVIYALGLHVFDFIDSYEDDLAQSAERIEARRVAFAESGGGFDVSDEALMELIADPEASESGAATYAAYCAACHGDAGQGLIGPNLTDEYWIHGGSPTDVFDIITAGVPDKGMPPWESSISAEDRARLVAHIASISGTNPPDARAPEGEMVGP